MNNKEIMEVTEESNEMEMVENATNRHVGEKWKKVYAVCSILVIGALYCVPVFADTAADTNTGAAVVSSSLGTLFDIIAAFVSSFGGIQVLWGVFEWGNAQNSNDGMLQSMSIKRIGGGLLEVVAPQIVSGLIG